MERYTKRLQNGVASWAYPNDCYGDDEVRNKVFKSVHRQNACEKLAAIEDILGDEYDLDRLREIAQADREGRCVVLPDGGCEDKDGENALKSAMNTCFYHNNPVTRFIADSVAEKLTRQEAQAALRRAEDE